MAIELFLSHISEERRMAIQLKESLQALFSGDVQVFTSSDTISIASGKNWLTSVKEAMNRATAVLVLSSRSSVQRSWVQFELGCAWIRELPIIPICHSGMRLTDLPLPLALMEGVEITEEGMERLHGAVAKILRTQRSAPPNALAAMLAALKDAESAIGTPLLQFERFIDIVLPRPGRLADPKIPAETPIESNEASLKLFGFLGSRKRTWRDIETAASKIKDQRWIKELQRCVHLASNDEDFKPVQAIYHTGTVSYQPQLSRKEFTPDGACRFHVHFVETVVAPLTEVQNEFGLMATLLRLGLRFRYEVIQHFHRQLMHVARGNGDGQPTVDERRTQLRNAVLVIENDALSRGAENIDRAAVSELFACDQDQEILANVQDAWDVARAALFEDNPPPNLEQMRQLIVAMRDLNYQFMSLGTKRFHEMVSERWRTPSRPGVACAAR